MSHRLEPYPDQPYLDPDEVVSRLRDEFRFVTADHNEGSDNVSGIIAKLVELNAPQEIIDEQLAGQESSYSIVASDDMSSDDYRRFIVQPDIGPLIGYLSAQHEEAVRPLLDRCAQALNYQIVLVQLIVTFGLPWKAEGGI